MNYSNSDLCVYNTALSPVPVSEPTIHVDHQTLDEDTKYWLTNLECEASHK